MQVDTRERGFSYAYDAPLDMRMDPSQELTAREIVAEWDERRLAGTLRELGEERHARRDRPRDRARARSEAPIETTQQLVDAISAGHPGAGALRRRASRQALLPGAAHRRQRRARPARRRAAAAPGACCARDGVLAAISFHSLEDRRVKRFLAERGSGLRVPARPAGLRLRPRAGRSAAVAPRDRAVRRRSWRRNPRAGSAHLRAARKLADAEDENGEGERR